MQPKAKSSICIIDDREETLRSIVGIETNTLRLLSPMSSKHDFLGCGLNQEWGAGSKGLVNQFDGIENYRFRYTNLSFADIIKAIFKAEKTLGPDFGGDSILFIRKGDGPRRIDRAVWPDVIEGLHLAKTGTGWNVWQRGEPKLILLKKQKYWYMGIRQEELKRLDGINLSLSKSTGCVSPLHDTSRLQKHWGVVWDYPSMFSAFFPSPLQELVPRYGFTKAFPEKDLAQNINAINDLNLEYKIDRHGVYLVSGEKHLIVASINALISHGVDHFLEVGKTLEHEIKRSLAAPEKSTVKFRRSLPDSWENAGTASLKKYQINRTRPPMDDIKRSQAEKDISEDIAKITESYRRTAEGKQKPSPALANICEKRARAMMGEDSKPEERLIGRPCTPPPDYVLDAFGTKVHPVTGQPIETWVDFTKIPI